MCHYMKTLIVIVALIILIIPAGAQRQISYGYTEIKKTQYDHCSKTSYLTANPQIKKQSGKLSVPVSGKPVMDFKDDTLYENFHEFEYLGDIKATKLSLIKKTEYNSEEFYLINRTTGTIDTLVGLPVFALNIRDFACINNPGTDKKQQIQICELRNGFVNTRAFLKGKADTFLEEISCVTRNAILTKDNNGKCWKLIFKIGDE